MGAKITTPRQNGVVVNDISPASRGVSSGKMDIVDSELNRRNKTGINTNKSDDIFHRKMASSNPKARMTKRQDMKVMKRTTIFAICTESSPVKKKSLVNAGVKGILKKMLPSIRNRHKMAIPKTILICPTETGFPWAQYRIPLASSYLAYG